MENNKEKIFTISNILSILRILLILPVSYCLMQEGVVYQYVLIALVFLSILSDYLDGWFARKLNQITRLGKILDPLADKLSIGIVLIILVIYRDFPVWLAAAIIARDVVIIVAGLLTMKKYKFVAYSNQIGKWAAFFISLLLLIYIFYIEFLKLPFMIIVCVFLLLSIISYGIRYITFIKKNGTLE